MKKNEKIKKKLTFFPPPLFLFTPAHVLNFCDLCFSATERLAQATAADAARPADASWRGPGTPPWTSGYARTRTRIGDPRANIGVGGPARTSSASRCNVGAWSIVAPAQHARQARAPQTTR